MNLISEGILMLMKRGNIIRAFERRSTPLQLYHVDISPNLDAHPTIKYLRTVNLFFTHNDGLFLDRTIKNRPIERWEKKKNHFDPNRTRTTIGKNLKVEVGYSGKNGDSNLSREINMINENFKNNLSLVNDLIEHIPAKGYKINSR